MQQISRRCSRKSSNKPCLPTAVSINTTTRKPRFDATIRAPTTTTITTTITVILHLLVPSKARHSSSKYGY
ncbi:hypothetical protein M0804_015128 [Polistes exclamans]|nr:hypothetical protein M0804_015128 [Polistes exclamans]